MLGAAEHLVAGVFGVAEHRRDPAEGPGAVGGRVSDQVGVEQFDDGVDGELAHGPPGVDLLDDRGAVRVQGQPGLGEALGGLGRVGVGDFLGQVAVGDLADVPALLAVLAEPFPGFFFQLEAEVFGESLLDPADQKSGRVDAFNVGGLVGGEQRNALVGQFPFQLDRIIEIAGGPLDVLDHDGGEPGLGARASSSRSARPPSRGMPWAVNCS